MKKGGGVGDGGGLEEGEGEMAGLATEVSTLEGKERLRTMLSVNAADNVSIFVVAIRTIDVCIAIHHSGFGDGLV